MVMLNCSQAAPQHTAGKEGKVPCPHYRAVGGGKAQNCHPLTRNPYCSPRLKGVKWAPETAHLATKA